MTAQQAPSAEEAQLAPEPSHLRVRVSQPRPDVIVLTVLGTVDDRTIHDLEDVAWPRLAAFSGTTVIDLSHTWLIDVPGLQMLTQAYMRTQARGVGLRVVVGSGEVLEALRAAGLSVLLDIHPTVQDALAADQERTPDCSAPAG